MPSMLIKTILVAASLWIGLLNAELIEKSKEVDSSEAIKNSETNTQPSSSSLCRYCPAPKHPHSGPSQCQEQGWHPTLDQIGCYFRWGMGAYCEGVRMPKNATTLTFPPAKTIGLLEGVYSTPYLTDDGGYLLAWTSADPSPQCYYYPEYYCSDSTSQNEQYLALYHLKQPNNGGDGQDDIATRFDKFTVRNARIVSAKASSSGLTVVALVQPTNLVPPLDREMEIIFYVWSNRPNPDGSCYKEDEDLEYRVYTLPLAIEDYKVSDTLLAVSTFNRNLFVFDLNPNGSHAPIQITGTMHDMQYNVGPDNYLVYVDCDYTLGEEGTITTYPNVSSTACLLNRGIRSLHAVTFLDPVPGESPLTRRALININAELYSLALEVWAVRRGVDNQNSLAVADFSKEAMQFQPHTEDDGNSDLRANAVGIVQFDVLQSRTCSKNNDSKLFALDNQTFVQAMYFKSSYDEEYLPTNVARNTTSSSSSSLYFLRSSFANWKQQEWFVVEDMPLPEEDDRDRSRLISKFDYVRAWESESDSGNLTKLNTVFTLGKVSCEPPIYVDGCVYHGSCSSFSYSRASAPDVPHR